MSRSHNLKIRIPKEHYLIIKEEARRRGKTFTWVFREKAGFKNPPWK